MKYYIISGEASGDLHAANLMKALKNEDSHAEFRFWGYRFGNQYSGMEIRRIETIGPKVGDELKLNALRAIFIALGLILIYISFWWAWQNIIIFPQGILIFSFQNLMFH